MTQECTFSLAKGTQRICGLLGTEAMSTAECESRIAALREIVERFHIQWELTAEVRGDSDDQQESGFTLELKGTHNPACHHSGDPCSHCASLMPALRIIGEWLLPPDGRCAFCETEACSIFVHGDKHNQGEACSTRTLRVASGPGTPCQVAQCHLLCTTGIKDRLAVLGAVEREKKQEFSGRV